MDDGFSDDVDDINENNVNRGDDDVLNGFDDDVNDTDDDVSSRHDDDDIENYDDNNKVVMALVKKTTLIIPYFFFHPLGSQANRHWNNQQP